MSYCQRYGIDASGSVVSPPGEDGTPEVVEPWLATGYTVALQLSDGRGLRLGVPAHHTSLFVARVSPRTKVLRVTVVAVTCGSMT